MSKWYEDKVCDEDIVISSRVRLARNLKKYPFPDTMNGEQAKNMIEDVKKAIINERTPLSQEFEYAEVNSMPAIKKRQLMEKHIISPVLVSKSENCGVLIKKDETVSIMLNEEDHIRIQTIFPGENIDKAWDLADKIDDLIEESIEYAYSEKYGYITACPTNMGTGLRASFMMHLPFIERAGQMKNVLSAVSKFGATIRGIYGEGSEALGSIYQVSNQVTMGQSEQEIIKNLKNVVSFVKEQEKKIRESCMAKEKAEIEDRIYRSLGTLQYARKISGAEAMKHLSNIREGYILNLTDIPKTSETIYNIMINVQPGNIQLSSGTVNDVNRRDEARAEYLRRIFKS